MKALSLQNNPVVSKYFWRTTQQQFDYIEETAESLTAWEFKWNTRKKTRIPKTFTRTYPEARCTVVTPDNFMDCLTHGTSEHETV